MIAEISKERRGQAREIFGIQEPKNIGSLYSHYRRRMKKRF
jgi:hypothetical protein